MAKRTVTQRVELSKSEISQAITEWVAKHLRLNVTSVDYRFHEVDGDPLDRFPGRTDIQKAVATAETEIE